MFHRGFGPRELLIKSRNQIILTITSFSIINHQSSYQEYQALLPETSVFARSRAVKIFSTILTHLQRAIIFTNVHHIDIDSLQQGAVGPEVARLVAVPANFLLRRGLHSASSKSIASQYRGWLPRITELVASMVLLGNKRVVVATTSIGRTRWSLKDISSPGIVVFKVDS